MNIENWFPRIKRWRGKPRYNENGDLTHGVFDDVEFTGGNLGGMRIHYYMGVCEHMMVATWIENGLPDEVPCFLKEPWGTYPQLPKKKVKAK